MARRLRERADFLFIATWTADGTGTILAVRPDPVRVRRSGPGEMRQQLLFAVPPECPRARC